MLATLVPLFYEDMSVASYCLYAQKENMFEHPHLLGAGKYDGAGSIVGIEVFDSISEDLEHYYHEKIRTIIRHI